MAKFCPFPTPRSAGRARYPERRFEVVLHDDDDEEEDMGMPLPDWRDPDWGFDDEETQPEDGDFWFDSDDEENAL